MLCYRCGSYNREASGACTVCGQPLNERRLTVSSFEGAPVVAGDTIADRYKVLEALAFGSCGWVFKVRDREADLDVALKLILPRLIQRTEEREYLITTIRSLMAHHPEHVLRLHDVGYDEPYVYYTTPFADGITLKKLLDIRKEQKQSFDKTELLAMLSQLSAAVDSVAEVGGHGSIRPHSVLMSPERVLLSAWPHARGIPIRPFVAAQRPLKADFYLAPELTIREERPTSASDIYALGVIAGELVTGLTFGRSLSDWKDAPKLDAGTKTVLTRATDAQPNNRFDSGAEFLARLTDALDHVGTLRPIALSDDEQTSPQRKSGSHASAQFLDEGSYRPLPFNAEPNADPKPASHWFKPGLGGWILFAAMGLLLGAALAVWRPELLGATLDALWGSAPENSPNVPDLNTSIATPPLNDDTDGSSFATDDFTADIPTSADSPSEEQSSTANSARRCPKGMLYISQASNESLEFCIDRYEYPNRAGFLPSTGIDFEAASIQCSAVQKRLCTGDEWAQACKGPDQHKFSVQGSIREDSCNIGGEGREPLPSGALPSCKSGYAVFDMTGNVSEWVQSETPRLASVKGGKAQQSLKQGACTTEVRTPKTQRDRSTGFRCCKDVL